MTAKTSHPVPRKMRLLAIVDCPFVTAGIPSRSHCKSTCCFTLGLAGTSFLKAPVRNFKQQKKASSILGKFYGIFCWLLVFESKLHSADVPPLPDVYQASHSVALCQVICLDLPIFKERYWDQGGYRSCRCRPNEGIACNNMHDNYNLTRSGCWAPFDFEALHW